MKLFRCQACSQVLYFENSRCERCGHRLGYLPKLGQLSALEPLDGNPAEEAWPGAWQALAGPAERLLFCANAAHGACNWMVPERPGGEAFCAACRHNRTVPDLTVAANLPPWRRLQAAQRRLVYTLLRLGLPLANRIEDPVHGLAFDVLADPSGGRPVLTGHEDGVITLALSEADDAERERRRAAMGEPYRTLLGHYRHESAHHYWDILVRDGGRLDACRAVFGDDRQDYAAALRAHYRNGPPADWQSGFVSAYATAHPWEDFAETWAHYLHIVDTLEMASAFGLRVQPKVAASPGTTIDIDPYRAKDVGTLIEAWLPLTYATNSLNRCMGVADLYPFVLSAAAITKLGFVHELMRCHVTDGTGPDPLRP